MTARAASPRRRASRAHTPEAAADALRHLDPGCPRKEWAVIGMAFKDAGGSEDDFIEWSRPAVNFKSEPDCAAAWRSFKPNANDGVGPGTLFKLAREAGWRGRINGHAGPQERPPEARDPAGGTRASSFDLEAVWRDSQPATAAHPYLKRKRGIADGLRVYRGPLAVAGQPLDGALLAPVHDADDHVQSWQAIPAEGAKRSAPGAAIAGGRFIVGGPPRDGEPLYVCEGIGQAWSAHRATGQPAVCCFGAGNVERVAQQLHERHPKARLVIVADAGKETDAERIAATLHGAWVGMPEGSPPNLDLNDVHIARGLPAARKLLLRAREPEQPERDDWPGDGRIGKFLRTPPPPVAWFAHDRLLAGRAHTLAGMGGSSKTRFQYHMGIGAVIGRLPWDWQINRTGSAALFLTEDVNEGLHRTIAAMARSMKLSERDLAKLDDRLRVFPLAGKPSHLLLAEAGGVLSESWRVERMLEVLRNLPPPLVYVGLDPALGLTEGDELDPAHQRKLGELVDRIAIELNACVVLNTHATKGLQALDEIGSHMSRGSGALTDAVRGEFVLRTMTAAEAKKFGITDIEERKSFAQLVGVKGNELPPAAFAPVWLRRGHGGALEQADLVERSMPSVGKREMDALAILRRLAMGGVVPRLKAWREACVTENLVTGPTAPAQEKAMTRIRDALLGSGLIRCGTAWGTFEPVQDEGAT